MRCLTDGAASLHKRGQFGGVRGGKVFVESLSLHAADDQQVPHLC